MKRTEIKRKNIIDAAVEEFRFHGFEGARTTRIAKAANVSSRTLYHHFETKEALFDAIIKSVIEETGAIPSLPFDPDKPLREQLINALKAYVEAITEEEYLGLNRMMMSEYLRDPDLARRIFAKAEMSNNPLKGILAGAIDAKLIKEVDIDYATGHITAGAKAHFFWPKFLIGAEPECKPDDTLGECVDMFLALYGKASMPRPEPGEMPQNQ
ncbi:MAG: TetR/AcrR family transcriptional regulator [Hyphomonadaceae bacterium]|nr:TetR/AcrR family transcriptional regulator [Hyphomonadaceae bacterium]MBC6412685.1 TetR/AcrR family transcriptional regulator [Hyphomonadaceae bacterium]